VLGEKGVFEGVGLLYQGGKWRQRSVAFIARGVVPAQLEPAYNGDGMVYTNTAALPRAFVVGSAQVMSATSVLACMSSPSFNPASSVLIEQEPPPGSGSAPWNRSAPGNCVSSGTGQSGTSHDEGGPAGTATITSYRNLSVDVTADMARPGWLVLGDINYPGWYVQVDGHAASIYTADYVVRAVPLSAGVHNVHFYFLPDTVLAGGAVSGVALLLALCVIIGSCLRSRRSLVLADGDVGSAIVGDIGDAGGFDVGDGMPETQTAEETDPKLSAVPTTSRRLAQGRV
jgi:hypothetical protein